MGCDIVAEAVGAVGYVVVVEAQTHTSSCFALLVHAADVLRQIVEVADMEAPDRLSTLQEEEVMEEEEVQCSFYLVVEAVLEMTVQNEA